MRTRITTLGALVLAFSFLWLRVADAYIDPGSGSFVFQALIGALLAATVGLKVFWRRIARFVTRRDRSPSEP